MLVVSRRRKESIVIGNDIAITVTSIQGDKVKLGISAPHDITVHRLEIWLQIRREKVTPDQKVPPVAPTVQTAIEIWEGR